VPYSYNSVDGMLTVFSDAIETVGGCTLESVMHASAMPDLWVPSQLLIAATAPWLVLISNVAEGRRLS